MSSLEKQAYEIGKNNFASSAIRFMTNRARNIIDFKKEVYEINKDNWKERHKEEIEIVKNSVLKHKENYDSAIVDKTDNVINSFYKKGLTLNHVALLLAKAMREDNESWKEYEPHEHFLTLLDHAKNGFNAYDNMAAHTALKQISIDHAFNLGREVGEKSKNQSKIRPQFYIEHFKKTLTEKGYHDNPHPDFSPFLWSSTTHPLDIKRKISSIANSFTKAHVDSFEKGFYHQINSNKTLHYS